MLSVFSLLVTFLVVPRNFHLSTPKLRFLGIYTGSLVLVESK
jgi:hypothetical protein